MKAYSVNLVAAAALAMFALGWLAGIAYGSFPSLDMQKPSDFFRLSAEKNSPDDRIEDSSIRVFDNRVVVYIKDPYLAKFEDTHSMEPVLHHKSTGLEIVPKSSSEIKPGDIISYKASNSDDIIIHRVVSAGIDSQGWYAIAKGDNNNSADPERIRFSQVKRILVGVLY